MHRQTKELYEFGQFVLDVQEHTLRRTDDPKELVLPEKAFQALRILVQRAGHLLTKQELLTEIWPDSFVEENNLDKCIHAIRLTLGEKPGERKYIETIRKHGYRFIAAVTTVGARDEGVVSVLDSEFLNEGKERTTATTPTISTHTTDSGAFVVSAKWKTDDNGDVIRDDGDRYPGSAHTEPSPALVPIRTTRPSKIVLAGVFIILAAAVGLAYFLYPAKITDAEAKTEFAILPVNPIDAANRNDLYEIGIADALIQALSSVSGFVVRPITEMREYTNIGQDPLAAGRAQQVDYVLASRYQIANGKIKITSQLINVANGNIEETYQTENEITSVFAVQDAFAGSMRNKLMARFARTAVPSQTKRGTTNDEAYNYYLQGTVLTDNRRADLAIENLEKAVALDPRFAQAWAAKAHAHFAKIGGSGAGKHEHHRKLIEAANKALELDANISEAYSALCIDKYFYEYDFAGAERACKRALELDPNSAIAHAFYSGYLSTRGHHDAAIAEVRIAIDLEPTSLFHKKTYAKALYWARRYDEAAAQNKQILEVDPNHHPSATNLFCISLMQGKDSEAFEWYMRSIRIQKTNDEAIQRYRMVYAASGWRGVLLESDFPIIYFREAGINARLGNKDRAFECLEKAFEDRTWLMAFLQIDPQLDSLREDARYLDLVRRVDPG